MRVALIGSTGTLGSRILAEALDRGHEVTALMRDPSRAPEGVADVRRADVTDAGQLAQAVAGHDAVISAIGGARQGNPRLAAEAAPVLIAALGEAGVKRLLIVGGAGSLEVESGGRHVDESRFPDAVKPASLSQCDALDTFLADAGGLQWTYLSPSETVEPGERTGKYSIGSDRLLVGPDGRSWISAEDYAVAMIDELENPAHVGRRFTVVWA